MAIAAPPTFFIEEFHARVVSALTRKPIARYQLALGDKNPAPLNIGPMTHFHVTVVIKKSGRLS